MSDAYDPRHQHEPEQPPVFDNEGRCLVCWRLVAIQDEARLTAERDAALADFANLHVVYDEALASLSRHVGQEAELMRECDALRAQLASLTARVEGAVRLHQNRGGKSWDECSECAGPWPCRTLRALADPAEGDALPPATPETCPHDKTYLSGFGEWTVCSRCGATLADPAEGENDADR